MAWSGYQYYFASWTKALRYVLPILCFMIGTYIAKLAYEYIYGMDIFKWQKGVLLTEMMVFIALGFIDATVPDLLVNSVISFFHCNAVLRF